MNSTLDDTNAGLPVASKLLDRILRSASHLVVLETANVAGTLAQMRTLAMRTGTSIYAWEPELGIASLRESGLQVPGSKRFGDALRYVLQSMHFGVYLFADLREHLKAGDTVVLRRIARMQGANPRKLVFIGTGIDLPEELEGLVEHVVATAGAPATLRLRDGRWE